MTMIDNPQNGSGGQGVWVPENVVGSPTTETTGQYSLTSTNSVNTLSADFGWETWQRPFWSGSPGRAAAGTAYTFAPTTTVTQVSGHPTTYSITSGSLPAGLSLNANTSAITGTPAANAASTTPYNFVITGNSGVTGLGAVPIQRTQSYSIIVDAPPDFTGRGQPAPALRNAAYPSTSVAVTSGTTPVTYSATGLPTGMTIDASTGAITGTPTAAVGSYPFTVTATNTATATSGTPVQQAFTMVVAVAPGWTTTSPTAATVNQAYTWTPTISGTGPFTFSVVSGTLPAGLSLNTSTGEISGTPTAAVTNQAFSIRATGASGSSSAATQPMTMSVTYPPLTLPSATLATGTDGTAYSSSAIAAAGGSGSYTYALANGTTLPSGLTLDPSTGAITGSTFGVTGTTGFSVTVTDSNSQTATRSYVLTFVQADPVLPTTTLANGTEGAPYATSVQASGSAPITYSISVGSLPPGITQSGKNITGTPTQAGSYTFTITAANDHTPYGSGTDSRSYTIVIDPAPPVMTGLASPGGATVGTPYSYTVTPTSGTGPFTFTVTSGSLPAGLTLNSVTGVISGTTTAGGTSSFTVRATNSAGFAAASLSIVSTLVAPGLLSSTTAATGTVGTAYTYTVAPSGSAPFTFALTGSLPAGLSFNTSTGVISGTPTTGGTATFTVTATNTSGSASTAVTLPVVQLPVVASTTTLPVASTTSAYSASIAASGTGLSFALAQGSSLPTGLTLNPSTGAITGTSTTAGTATFTVAVTNGAGTVSTAVTLVTQVPPTLASTTTAPVAAVGTAYSYSVAPTGTGPFTYSLTGTLPTGLTLNSSTGAISGTATTAGTGSFSITATNGAGSVTTAVTLPVLVAPTLPATTTLTAGVVGSAYSQSLTAAGTGPFTYSVLSGSLPAGLTLNAVTGVVSGTPTTAASGAFVVQASNGAGSASTTVSLTIAAPPGLPGTMTAATGSTGMPYSTTVAPTGTGPFTFQITGSLPAGLTLNTSTGVISGTPTASGVGTFSVTATNSLGSATTAVTLPVLASPTLPATTPAPAGTVGSAYSATVAPGGTGPFTFAIASGSLPGGLSLNASTGVISGTPTTAGTSNVTITVTNSAGAVASTAIALQIAATSTSGTPSSATAPSFGSVRTPPGAVLGAPYSTSLAAAGTGPVSYRISSGSLPTGVTLNASTGVLSGTPTAVGTFTFQITATNAQGTAAQQYSVTVSGSPASGSVAPAFTLPAQTSSTVGGTFSMSPTVSTASGAVTFAVASGSLPSGVTLDPTSGALTGTLAAPGVYRFSIAATNARGSTVHGVTVTVTAAAGSVADAKVAVNLAIAIGEAAEGARVGATASGMLPGSNWVITMHSTPRVIASGTVPASGRVAETVKLPSSIPAGSHMLVVNGTSMTGTAVSGKVWFAVTASKQLAAVSHSGAVSVAKDGSTVGGDGSLAETGFAALPWAGGAGALLIAGAAVLLFGRQRRRRLG